MLEPRGNSSLHTEPTIINDRSHGNHDSRVVLDRFLLLLFMRINKCENTPRNTFQIVKLDFYWNFMSVVPSIYRSDFAPYGVVQQVDTCAFAEMEWQQR